MKSDPSNSSVTDYSPDRALPAWIVCASAGAVFVMIAVILAYAAWTARQAYSRENIAREAEAALRHGRAVTVQPPSQATY